MSFLALIVAASANACTIESDDNDDDKAGSSGTAGTGGTGGTAGTGGTGGTGGQTSSACGVLQGPAEAEPNDDNARATPYDLAQSPSVKGCLIEQDHDAFSFTAPADGTGGGVLISITGVGDGAVQVLPYVEGDNAELSELLYQNEIGANLTAYFAVEPGRKYYMQVTPFTFRNDAFTYTLKASYAQTNDKYEPNDTPATAKPIAVGAPVDAYYFKGFSTAQEPTDEEIIDYYSVDLEGGDAVIDLTDVPSTLQAEVVLIDPDSNETKASAENLGGDVSLSATELEAGKYLVEVRSFVDNITFAGVADALPGHFTKPYRLTVTQP